MANRVPLVVDSSNYRVEELPIGDTLDVNGASITGATFTGIATFNGNVKLDSSSSLGNGPSIVLNNNGISTAYGSGKTWSIISTGSLDASGAGNLVVRDQTGGGAEVTQGRNDYITVLSRSAGYGQTDNGSAHEGSIGFGCTAGAIKADLYLSKYASGEGVVGAGESSYARELAMWVVNTAPDGRSVIGFGTNYSQQHYGYVAYQGRTNSDSSGGDIWARPRATTLVGTDTGGLEIVAYSANSPVTDGGIRFYSGSNSLRMAIRADQLGVGIGTSVANTPLHLVGAFTFQNRGTPSTQTALHINTTTGVVVETASSRRYKRDIEDYTKGLETVLQLRPVSFKYQDDENPNTGLIAEEVNELGLPEFVRYDAENAPHSIPYENLTALLINAIKDLKEENNALKARLDAAGL